MSSLAAEEPSEKRSKPADSDNVSSRSPSLPPAPANGNSPAEGGQEIAEKEITDAGEESASLGTADRLDAGPTDMPATVHEERLSSVADATSSIAAPSSP